MLHRVKNIKNANLDPREIAYFLKFAKMYTRKNIYVHSMSLNGEREAIAIDRGKNIQIIPCFIAPA